MTAEHAREWVTRTIPCGLCGSAEDRTLFEKDGFRYARCEGCGFVFVNPQLMPEEIERIYAIGFANKSASKPTPPDFFSYAGIVKWARRYRRLNRLLDVGCFKGHLLLAARADGWDPFGVELAADAASCAREQHQLRVVTGELEQAGFEDASFDAIVLQDVFEHVADPVATLRSVKRLLRPGGGLYVETPNFDSLTSRWLGRDWAAVFPWHQSYFTPRTATRAMTTAGLRVCRIRTMGFAPFSRYNALRALQARREIARGKSGLKAWLRRRARFLRKPYFLIRDAGNVPFALMSALGVHAGTKMVIEAERPAK